MLMPVLVRIGKILLSQHHSPNMKIPKVYLIVFNRDFTKPIIFFDLFHAMKS